MTRPGYPTRWEAGTKRKGGGGWVGLVFRLMSPTEMHEAACVHQHRTAAQAHACADGAAHGLNLEQGGVGWWTKLTK